jgi:hypothetical protein
MLTPVRLYTMRPQSGPFRPIFELLEAREVPAVAFQSLPTVPSFDPETLANLRNLAQQGRANGLQQNIFIKAGDSNTATTEYLTNLGNPATTSGALPADLTDTLNTFRAPISATGTNSFNRVSSAAVSGWTSREVDRTIAGEIQATRAGVALIMIGTNDTALTPFEEYKQRLASIVDQVMAQGAIPVLLTIPHLMYRAPSSDDAAAARNQAISDLADLKNVPVINLWNALNSVPLLGLKNDLVHLNVSPNGSGALGPADLAYGQNVRAFLILQTLTELRKQVLSYDAAKVAAETQTFWNPLQAGGHYLVTGSDAGQPAVITVTDPKTGTRLGQIQPFEASFLGGVRVAQGDLDGDGIPDIVAAAGPTGGPVIKIYSGKTGQPMASFFAYEESFRGGVTVAVGDENGDGKNELAIGSGVGGGPRVRVFQGPGTQLLRDFMALDPNFRGGVNVAIGGFGLATSAGDSGGPIVQLFDPGATQSRAAFFVYDPSFRGGVNLSAGDLNGDGQQELYTAAGPGGGPHIRIWNPKESSEVASFVASANSSVRGYRVTGSSGQVFVASSSGPAQPVRSYSPSGQLLNSFGTAGEEFLLNGVNLAAG